MKWITPLLKRVKTVAPVRLVVMSFFAVILTGTFLLMLPLTSRSGLPTPFIDALFTATSATCVTGLVVYDTWTHWNEFGQIIILSLIQIGGLGLVTFTTGFAMLLRGKLSLRTLWLTNENTAGNTINVLHLVKVIFSFTFFCEFVGALLLSIRFVPQFQIRGIWIAVFTSVSAYCNAGFDILGFRTPDQSLIPYVGDPLVCVTVAGLIILGGLGFIVVSDIFFAKVMPRITKKEKTTHVNLHSIVAISMTCALLVIGTIAFFLMEYHNTLAPLPFGAKLNASFFQSASLRTAGFASIPIGLEHDFTKLFSVLMMFIGASPASTGGGIKTTTFLVLAATVASVLRGKDETILFRRRIDKSVVYRSLTILTVAFMLVMVTTGVILSTNSHIYISAIDALFESTSAFATVGLTTGITPVLSAASKAMLSATMFIGRVGPVSLGLALASGRPRQIGEIIPEGKIIVG